MCLHTNQRYQLHASCTTWPLKLVYTCRFRDEWLKGHDPKDFYFRLKEKLTVPWVSCTPHKDLSGPDYLHVRESQCQMMAVNLHGSIVSNFSNY